jgi:CBS domain-containing protein
MEDLLDLPLGPAYESDPPQLYSPNHSLASAIRDMGTNQYSQLVVWNDEELALLTLEGIVIWLAHQALENSSVLVHARIADALAYELRDSFMLMTGTHTARDARNAFMNAYQREQPYLYAILLTESGRPDEKPFGIVTLTDVREFADAWED